MSLFFFAPRVVAAPAYTEVAASLTRYDSTDGEALFRGTIPFAPGVIASESDLDTVRVLVNGSEPSGGLWIEPLEYYHAGSTHRDRVAYVEFTATCGSAETVPCTVRIGQARTVPDRASVTDSVERSPRAWQAAPTLFAITDADYLCASRVAPLPLVPVTHPGLPASVVTWLTTTFDDWNATAVTGASTYDEQYALICRYLTSGNPAFLAEALERNQSENTPTVRQRLPFSYWVGDGSTTWAGVDLNPADYTKSTGDTNGAPNEANDQSLTALMVYALTGWEYGRIHVERNATAQWFNDFRQTTAQLNTNLTLNGNTFGYPRQAFRWILQQGTLAHTVRMARHYDVGGGLAFKQPGDPHGTSAFSITERVGRVLDRIEAYNATVVPGAGTVPSWWTGLLGVGVQNIDGTLERCPNFQFVTSASLWMAYMNGADTRASIPGHLDAIAEWCRGQVVLNSGVYTMPYSATDPAALGTPTNGTTTSVSAWLFAWEFARSGSTAARDLYDAACAVGNLTVVGQGPETKSRKILGELFYMAFHGAALRAGVPWNGWEV